VEPPSLRMVFWSFGTLFGTLRCLNRQRQSSKAAHPARIEAATKPGNCQSHSVNLTKLDSLPNVEGNWPPAALDISWYDIWRSKWVAWSGEATKEGLEDGYDRMW
jgi:hypothetical protein